MSVWPFGRDKDRRHRVAELEEEVRHERGNLAVKIVDFERADNALDIMVRQHLELLRGSNSEAPH